MKDPNNPCLFCNISESGSALENEFAYASYDSYPVSEHHCLIIPKRHIKDFFELTNEELISCNNLIKKNDTMDNCTHCIPKEHTDTKEYKQILYSHGIIR